MCADYYNHFIIYVNLISLLMILLLNFGLKLEPYFFADDKRQFNFTFRNGRLVGFYCTIHNELCYKK